MSKPRIAFIGSDHNQNLYRKEHNLYGGVTYYRLIKPKQYLEQDFDIDYWGANLPKEAGEQTNTEFWDGFMKRYDLIITKVIDNPGAIAHILFFAERHGVPILLDIDDNLFEVKEDQPAYEFYGPGKNKRAIVASALSLVDGILVSTEPLKNYYKKFLKDVYKIEKPIYVLPNCNDISDWNFPTPVKDEKKVTIGWMGSITHDEDLKMILPAIRNLMNKYPNLYFEVCGGMTKEFALEFFKGWEYSSLERIETIPGTLSWMEYPELVMNFKWDIGIAPLINDEFTRGKSHIKWLEYAMAKIPCVASRVFPYFKQIYGVNTIQDGKTGYLCNPDEWEAKLENLIKSKYLRDKIGSQAYDFVKSNWQYSHWIYLWRDVLRRFLFKKE